jgi:hypothetical protein
MSEAHAERYARGPMSGRNILGEVTEAVHKYLLEGYDISPSPPRVEEDLQFVPKDREEVIYIYMYRVAQNANLMNQKRWRVAPIFTTPAAEDSTASQDATLEPSGEVYYHRPPLLLDVFYLILVHSKFKSDAERLMGWVLLRLNEATHLIYRPRKFMLPDGRAIDSLGRTWTENPPDHDQLFMEKVSLALVDDLTVGDAVNLFTLHEAPYRPFLTYRARVALDGPLVMTAGGTSVRMGRLEPMNAPDAPGGPPARVSRNGRIRPLPPVTKNQEPPGPPAHSLKKNADRGLSTEDAAARKQDADSPEDTASEPDKNTPE